MEKGFTLISGVFLTDFGNPYWHMNINFETQMFPHACSFTFFGYCNTENIKTIK